MHPSLNLTQHKGGSVATDYTKRLKMSILGDPKQKFFSPNGVPIATGYTRVVIGGRGPYVEFLYEHLDTTELVIKDGEEWRQQSDNAMYGWYEIDGVKLYHQRKVVDYADYRIGRWYVSPFDMVNENGSPFIKPLRRKKS